MAPPDEKNMDEKERIAYLRERGVEISLPEERAKEAEEAAKAASAASETEGGATGSTFSFVHIPADINQPVSVLEAKAAPSGDVLKTLLAPAFDSNESMDAETVARETAGRLKNMLVSGNLGAAGEVKAPSAEEVQKQAQGGVCEAYPLSRPNNKSESIHAYIDEVGALRGRPRNKRLEDLARSAGLADLPFHGDGYIGRVSRAGGVERNVNFTLEELSSSSPWVQEAAATHRQVAAEQGHGSDEHLASGDAGTYAWNQTDEEVEVKFRSAVPDGANAKKRIGVSYGRGDKLCLKVDGNIVVELSPLFAKVVPDDCTWSLDGSDIVVTMTKADSRAWVELLLPHSK
mmetsp:Transcript_66715/g.139273  ORF Transcript_66715/g.139273 Transcript_66715/m.139273 type:complete len:346 (-) Transcript_66715:23-1060(-)